MSMAHPDPVAFGEHWSRRLEAMLRACARDRDVLPADRSTDVRFHEFMADESGTVQRIYDLARQPMTAEARAAMDRFVVDHPRGRHGAIEYDLAQFGLDSDSCHAMFGFYTDRFAIPLED